MKRFVSLLILFAAISGSASAKLIMINIKEVLQEAAIMKTIIVTGYEGSEMLYQVNGSNKIFRIDCAVKKSSESFREMQIKGKFMKPSDLSGKWPEIGQTVLILISSKNRVLLFAAKSGTNYRFWDPNSIPFANSMFEIPKESSFKPVPGCQNIHPDDADYWFCTDGCLVSVDRVKEHY